MIRELYSTMLESEENTGLEDLYLKRGIVQDYQKEALEAYGVIPLNNVAMLQIYNNERDNKDLGLFSANGYCILSNRFIIPVTDIAGEYLTLIGYYPDQKKYITLPTPDFNKGLDWFNIHNAYMRSFDYDGLVFVVEGIFDALMIHALGLPVVAAMGSAVGHSKGTILNIFKRAVIIPDADEIGQRAMSKWRIPIPHTFVKIPKKVLTFGSSKLEIKDPDDLIKYYPREDLYNLFLKLGELPGKRRLEVLEL